MSEEETYVYGEDGGGYGAGYMASKKQLRSDLRCGAVKVKFETEWAKDEDGIARRVRTKKYVRVR